MAVNRVYSSLRLRISGGLFSQCCSRNFPISFSTVSAKKKQNHEAHVTLIRVVDSEINFALDSVLHHSVVEVPDGFPFKIKDKHGKRFLVLERDYQGETVRVTVDMSKAGYEENIDSEKGASDHDGKKEPELSLPMVVSMSKGDDSVLQFDVKVFPEKMSIYGMSIRTVQPSETSQVYEGPSFLDFDSNLQEAFHKYLEGRGLTSGTIKFLLEYVITKDAREYLRWLKNLRKFLKN